MPESIQIQSKSNLGMQIKEIEVPKRVYTVVKSVVDSSTKPDYHWNEPIVGANGSVRFVKYKALDNGVEVKAWEIDITPVKIQKEGVELAADLVSVYDGADNLVAELLIRKQFLPSEQGLDGHKRYVIRIKDFELAVKSLHELEYYVIRPSEYVPYVKPIGLADFINKLIFYYRKAIEALKG